MNWHILILTILTAVAWSIRDFTCGPGYSHGPNGCIPCRRQTYMPYTDHRHGRCFPCDSDPMHGDMKIVISPCTPTSNIVIGCNREAYRIRSICKLCKVCTADEMETKSCTEESDRECRPLDPNPTTTCGPGQFLGKESCMPCPPHTYMPHKDHKHNECWPCDFPLEGEWKEVFVPCTRTSNAVIGCSRQKDSEAYSILGRCSPCRICRDDEIETTPCTQDSNRECKTLGSTPTRDFTCDPGYFRGEKSCVPCPIDTYMPEKDHRHQECWPCDFPLPGEWKEVFSPCTRTSNTVIKCSREKDYESYSIYGGCKPCRICGDDEVETTPCTQESNRECKTLGSP